MKLCAICGMMMCWFLLWFGVERIREIPDGAGLFEHYCSNCEQVVETRFVGDSRRCVNCGVAAPTKFGFIMVLLGAAGGTYVMVVLLKSRLGSITELYPPS